jgi:LacI family transcriptional regulator
MKVLRQVEVNLPTDLSLICFDDLDWFQFAVPSLSAVSINPTKLARAALHLLMERLRNSETGEMPAVFMEIQYQLQVRSSTVAPRSGPMAIHLQSESS